MTKKIFIISATALGIILLFLAIYNFVFRKETATENQMVSQSSNVDANLIGKKKEKQGAAILMAEDQALQATLMRDSERIRYYAVDGTVWEIESDGTGRKQVSDKTLPGLKNVSWSPDGTRVITSFSGDGKTDFFTYDYQTKRGMRLKDNLDTVVWDSIGAKIIYKYYDQKTKQRTINIANPDGSEWKTIADVPFKNIMISAVPQTSLISFWNAPTAFEETSLQTVGVAGGEVTKTFAGRFGADYLWSGDGNNILVSSLVEKNGKKLTLGVLDRAGTYRDLNIPTLASKCIWSADNKTVYYALPGGIPENSVLPDEYISRKFYTADTFWKTDINTGKKERVAELGDINEQLDASKLFLSEGETDLFFINRVDRKLYKIAL